MTPEEKHETLLRYFGFLIGGVDPSTLLAVRARVLVLPGNSVRQTLVDVIDGQLALREIAFTSAGRETSLVVQEKPEFPAAGKPWENILGMRFVPVPRLDVLFCIWDVRVQDFEAFVRATGHGATAGMISLAADGWWEHGDTWKSPGFAQGSTHPVCGVNWEDAQAFCGWLTTMEQAEGRIGRGQKYRLPTDAEWSTAVGLDEPCEGTPESKNGQIKGVYPWGTQWPPPPNVGNYAGTEVRDAHYWPSNLEVIDGYNDGYPRTSPVGSFGANKFGLYDMGGNVSQWCEDSYRFNFGARVLRGGSFAGATADRLLSSHRGYSSPETRGAAIGFRCVVTVEDASLPAAGSLAPAVSSISDPPAKLSDLELGRKYPLGTSEPTKLSHCLEGWPPAGPNAFRWERDHLRYHLAGSSGDSQNWVRTMTPTKAQWGEWWRVCDEVDVWSWPPKLGNMAVFDGLSWILELEVGNRSVVSRGQVVGAPPEFEAKLMRLHRALQAMTGWHPPLKPD